MAQPAVHILKYVDVMEVEKGVVYNGSAITTGNVMQMKTKGVSVIINSANVSFLTTFDDLNYVDASTTYTFDKDCVVAICDMVEVT